MRGSNCWERGTRRLPTPRSVDNPMSCRSSVHAESPSYGCREQEQRERRRRSWREPGGRPQIDHGALVSGVTRTPPLCAGSRSERNRERSTPTINASSASTYKLVHLSFIRRQLGQLSLLSTFISLFSVQTNRTSELNNIRLHFDIHHLHS